MHSPRRDTPLAYLLDSRDPAGLADQLRRLGWIGPSESIQAVERAGEGNMNCTLRVTLPGRSVVLKQSRPWVEKYPSIAAPMDRALAERDFYALVAGTPGVADRMPRLLASDASLRLLAFEDLGPASDLTTLYAGESLDAATRTALVDYLSALHAIPQAAGAPRLTNREMRVLNHEHIFRLPLSADAPDLDRVAPGLQRAAGMLREDARYVSAVRGLGDRYLSDGGGALVHGDYFPGSWVRTPGGVRVIDPEFGFVGPPEFDLGVMAAHFVFARLPQPITGWEERYRGSVDVDVALVRQVAGVEIMRRLLGVAQLPLVATLDERIAWLELSRRLVLDADAREVS